MPPVSVRVHDYIPSEVSFSEPSSLKSAVERVWMGIVGQARRALKRAVVAASPKLAPQLRRAVANADGNGWSSSIELIGVYDLEGGAKSYRFACIASGRDSAHSGLREGKLFASDILAFDIYGRPIDAACEVLAYPCVERNARSFVASVQVRGALSGMFIVVDAFGVGCFDSAEIAAFERRRDIMMCNPGIDGLYGEWVAREDERMSLRPPAGKLSINPLMSVVTPVYNTPLHYLHELVDSMLAQTYGNWEHVLVNASPENAELSLYLSSLDDARFKVVTLDENLGIPGNTLAGIGESSGDYISFVDHDDVVSPRILEEYVRAIEANPEADLLYCDEDTLSEDGAVRSHPIFKPELQPDLLMSWNYALHMLTVSRWAYERIVPYGDDVNGAQDYDLTLKAFAVARDVARVPGVLYHWREHDGSLTHGGDTLDDSRFNPSMTALSCYLASIDVDAAVRPRNDIEWLYRTDYARSKAQDVSLVVNSTGKELTQRLLDSLSSQREEILCETIIVGDSDLNSAIADAKGELIVLVDDGVTFIEGSDALGRMRDALARPDLGVVSAKSMTREGLNLHVGLCVKGDGSIGYLNQGFMQGMGGGYNGCAECQCDYSAVDMSCAAFRKSDFLRIGGFSDAYDSKLAGAVDFSFAMRGLGKLVMVDADARVMSLAHVEQLVIGADHVPAGSADWSTLWSRWGAHYRQDVLGNPNYTLDNSYFNLKVGE